MINISTFYDNGGTENDRDWLKHFYLLLTYLLTPRSRVLLEQLISFRS
jgi:hypothetical protein